MSEIKSKCVKCGAEILTSTAERTGGLCLPCKQGRPRPVTLASEEAEVELEHSAASLEARARLLRITTRKISSEQWATLTPHLQEIVPDWYRRLLSRFSLYGIGLEYRDQKQPYVRLFSFAGPDDFNSTLDEGSDCMPLVDAGFLPFGYESDGSLWLIQHPYHASSIVYLLEHSGWDGGTATKANGLVFAASRLSLLLCSMGVSTISYQDSPHGVTSVIWHEDCAQL
jgi:hypothetical protein